MRNELLEFKLEELLELKLMESNKFAIQSNPTKSFSNLFAKICINSAVNVVKFNHG